MRDYRYIEPTAVLVVKINGKTLYAHIEHNPSSDAFIKKMTPSCLLLDMRDNGGVEKTAILPWTLPESGAQAAAKPGDIVLYGDNSIALCYDASAGVMTKLASISKSKVELCELLGDGSVTVEFSLEWSE